jgi:hypothetical protein
MLSCIIVFFPTIFSLSIPSGVQIGFNVSDLIALGFVPCYSATYGTTTTIALLQSSCPDPGGNSTIFIGGQKGSDASKVMLGAFAPYCDVFTPTSSLSQGTLRNGAYWYNYPSKGFGFAGVSSITLSVCDTITATNSSTRLCWHVTAGGYRIGTLRSLNSNTVYYKVAYTKIGSAPYICPTFAPTNFPTAPTISPTAPPTSAPTMPIPTSEPTTQSPTPPPTTEPTQDPTFSPTSDPTQNPTSPPTTIHPTLSPTIPKFKTSSSGGKMKNSTIIAVAVGLGGSFLAPQQEE